MVIDVAGFCNIHQIGGSATHPIVRFFGRLALLLLLAWDGSPDTVGRSPLVREGLPCLHR